MKDMISNKQYEPYGPEWEKEMMKMKKADIIQFYKRAVKQPTRQGDECPNQT